MEQVASLVSIKKLIQKETAILDYKKLNILLLVHKEDRSALDMCGTLPSLFMLNEKEPLIRTTLKYVLIERLVRSDSAFAFGSSIVGVLRIGISMTLPGFRPAIVRTIPHGGERGI